jgi:hypothetical protein
MSSPPSWAPPPTRWRVEDYKSEPLTAGRGDGVLRLHYRGQLPIDAVPLEHARWFAELASQLRLEQVAGAFAAAGATPDQARRFATVLLEKIEELTGAVATSQLYAARYNRDRSWPRVSLFISSASRSISAATGAAPTWGRPRFALPD